MVSSGGASSPSSSYRPQEHSCKRVTADRPQAEERGSQMKKLRSRETCAGGNLAFKRSVAEEKFRNFELQEEFDTHDPHLKVHPKLPFLRLRSKVVELIAAGDLIFALAHAGLCAAFSRDSNRKVCTVNAAPEEVIRSLFYNKNNDSLITVSVDSRDNFTSLKCRSTPLEYLRRGQPDGGFPLFADEQLKWPGFVEFDDVNSKVLTYTAAEKAYKVYDLKNYNKLYTVRESNVKEIKISPGIMLLIFERLQGHIPLKILSIEDGSVLKSFNHMLHRTLKVDFVEQFNEKLLLKQENCNLQILDVRTGETAEVPNTEAMTPSAFIFLYENQLFLTFRDRTVHVWNSRGEQVTCFEDHLLWYPDCNTNNIYITSEQDLIISYCKSSSAGGGGHPRIDGSQALGSINVSNILTGKCIAKIQAADDWAAAGSCGFGDRSTPAEALEDVTSLFYDEGRNEILTGNRRGLVHVWSN